MSEEEKKAIEEIKKDDEYHDILHNIKINKYNMWNVQKLMRDTTDGSYTEYEIAQCIVYFVNLIEKQQKVINELLNIVAKEGTPTEFEYRKQKILEIVTKISEEEK